MTVGDKAEEECFFCVGLDLASVLNLTPLRSVHSLAFEKTNDLSQRLSLRQSYHRNKRCKEVRVRVGDATIFWVLARERARGGLV